MSYRLGDDPSGQTIYDGEEMVAVGCTPQAADALVGRLNSEPVRQEDVDLLRWLLAECEAYREWGLRTLEILRNAVDQSTDERNEAREAALFWQMMGGGST